MLKKYYLLTKPGIVRGNLMTAAAGFLFAAEGHIDWGLFAALLVGTALIIASGCVFNNYLDRGIDKVMDRTKKRSLVIGDISARSALTYATALALIGFCILAVYTNFITVIIGFVGIIDYVIIYGWAKRTTVHSTLIGSISGSTSLVAGYTAVVGNLDTAALLLFLIMFFWQMPHFYAIGIYRRKDYAAAHLPILTVKKGVASAKRETLLYIIGYIAAVSLLAILGYAGYAYLAIMLAVMLWWLWVALQGPKARDDIQWAYKIFGISLVVLMVFSVMISLDHWLP